MSKASKVLIELDERSLEVLKDLAKQDGVSLEREAEKAVDCFLVVGVQTPKAPPAAPC